MWVEDVNHVGKKTCLVCDSVITATTFKTEAYQETFKIQSGSLTLQFVVKSYTLGKWKPNFIMGLIITEVNIERLERAIGKFLRNYITQYCLDGHNNIEDWDFLIFEQCETHAQLKERETFWQHRLKTFHPIVLNEKEEYLYWHKNI